MIQVPPETIIPLWLNADSAGCNILLKLANSLFLVSFTNFTSCNIDIDFQLWLEKTKKVPSRNWIEWVAKEHEIYTAAIFVKPILTGPLGFIVSCHSHLDPLLVTPPMLDLIQLNSLSRCVNQMSCFFSLECVYKYYNKQDEILVN